MQKLAVFFNTLTKMKAYDLEKLLEPNIDLVGVVSQKDSRAYKKIFSPYFKKIIVMEDRSADSNFSGIQAKLTQLCQKYERQAVRFICLSEDYLLLTAMLREKCKITGLKPKSATYFRNKVAMKEKLSEAGLLNIPMFSELIEFEELISSNNYDMLYEQLKTQFGEKFVIKPKDAFGGYGVSIINNIEQLEIALQAISNYSSFQVETFVHGTLYHIDSVYVNGKPAFQACCQSSHPNLEFQTGKPIVNLPLKHDDPIFIKSSELSQQVIKAFGYSVGATHLEFFHQKDGSLIFLEIAARTPGAITCPLYEKQFNVNMLNMDFLVQFDLLEIDKPINKFAASNSYYLSGIFPVKQGRVIRLNNPRLRGAYSLDYKVKVNDVLMPCESLRDISATILVENSQYEDAQRDFKYLAEFNAIQCS